MIQSKLVLGLGVLLTFLGIKDSSRVVTKVAIKWVVPDQKPMELSALNTLKAAKVVDICSDRGGVVCG